MRETAFSNIVISGRLELENSVRYADTRYSPQFRVSDKDQATGLVGRFVIYNDTDCARANQKPHLIDSSYGGNAFRKARYIDACPDVVSLLTKRSHEGLRRERNPVSW
jgi:hypothetical protein